MIQGLPFRLCAERSPCPGDIDKAYVCVGVGGMCVHVRPPLLISFTQATRQTYTPKSP